MTSLQLCTDSLNSYFKALSRAACTTAATNAAILSKHLLRVPVQMRFPMHGRPVHIKLDCRTVC